MVGLLAEEVEGLRGAKEPWKAIEFEAHWLRPLI